MNMTDPKNESMGEKLRFDTSRTKSWGMASLE